ncbi:MAG: M20/M25/M40 family metallo-hydrolase [Candidatus Zhuqueibacterota bacterium]
MKFRLVFLVLAVALVWQPLHECVAQVEITADELRDHISFLASDSLKGRKPGTREGDIAAEYIRDLVVKNGLKPVGENGFQYFNVVTAVELGDRNSLSFGSFQGENKRDYIPLSFSANGKLTANVVFVGYGLDFDADSISWHDYQNMDVAGKWVVMLFGYPEMKIQPAEFEKQSPIHKKIIVAKDKGCAGVLFVSGEKYDPKDELTTLYYEQGKSSVGMPVLHVKRNIADSLFAGTGKNIANLEATILAEKKPVSFATTKELTAEVDVVKKEVRTQNVVAVLDGADKVLKNEYIVLGAHYDHLGMGGMGSGSRRPDTLAIHNGADDNASGVAGILEIIEKLAANRKSLKRSILFIGFGAEEMGTVGSKYFINHPLVDLKQIKYMFNLDMVGRLDKESQSLSVSGTGTAVGLDSVVKTHTRNSGLSARLSSDGYGPSDHAPFYISNISVLSFMTSIHADYHTPVDDVEKINFEGEKKIADLVYSLITDLANRSEVLAFQEAGPKTQPGMTRRFKVTLGIMPDVVSTDIKGLRADAVLSGRPAANAGMQKGDIIVAMEGKPIHDIYEYMHRLADFKVGQRISIEVMRNGKKEILIVEL